MIMISRMTAGLLETNIYFAVNEETHEAVILDPGADAEGIRQKLSEMKAEPQAVLLTHGHYDHFNEAEAVASIYHVPIFAAGRERALLGNASWNLSEAFGDPKTLSEFSELKEGDRLLLLGESWDVLETPGHTAGSICFDLPDSGLLFSGDTLFYESFGRTDFPTGSENAILESVKRLLRLPEETRVLPGHGGETRIGYERGHNQALFM